MRNLLFEESFGDYYRLQCLAGHICAWLCIVAALQGFGSEPAVVPFPEYRKPLDDLFAPKVSTQCSDAVDDLGLSGIRRPRARP